MSFNAEKIIKKRNQGRETGSRGNKNENKNMPVYVMASQIWRAQVCSSGAPEYKVSLTSLVVGT